ncbi:MAG: cyclic nucleotide-binding domain-containing protein [Oligoflexia bacterium]|nr:cyclic nucleotide-binding domain-containing protein [Oligoflexia bacterium]
MNVIEGLAPRERARLLAASERIHLSQGQVLLRHGDPGGDIYLLEHGTLEVLDTQSSPAVVLDILPAGNLVGEMAFLDQRTRTADVRAAEACVCRHWARDRLLKLLEDDPSLGASVYRVLAEVVVERSRTWSHLVASGAIGAAPAPRSADGLVHRLADPLRRVLMNAEPGFRSQAVQAERQVRAALDRLQADLAWAMSEHGADGRRALGLALADELHPYLIRSHLAEFCIAPPSSFTEEPLALAHLHRQEAGGDGELGEVIDAWLMERPTARGIRSRASQATETCEDHVGRQSRVALFNASRSVLLPRLLPVLLKRQASLTLLENDRASLDHAVSVALGTGSDQRPTGAPCLPKACLRPVLMPLVAALLAGQRPDIHDQDLVFIGGILDYLPDRTAARLVRTAASMLAPGGHLVLTALSTSVDAPIFHYLLAWPTVRRPASALLDLVSRSGLAAKLIEPSIAPGMVVVARHKARLPHSATDHVHCRGGMSDRSRHQCSNDVGDLQQAHKKAHEALFLEG